MPSRNIFCPINFPTASMILVPTEFVSFNLNFLGSLPLSVTNQISFASISYSEELVTIPQSLIQLVIVFNVSLFWVSQAIRFFFCDSPTSLFNCWLLWLFSTYSVLLLLFKLFPESAACTAVILFEFVFNKAWWQHIRKEKPLLWQRNSTHYETLTNSRTCISCAKQYDSESELWLQ
jgi:hypothetical protein